MKKDGFTLIEIIVSITLVSVVLVSMMGTLIKLKEVYSLVDEDTDILVYGASLTRIITNDIITNGDIKTIRCSETGDLCSEYSIYDKLYLTLGNGKKRLLEIIPTTNDAVNPLNIVKNITGDDNTIIGHETIVKNSIRYTDTTDTVNKKLLYIKTLELIKTEVEENSIIKETVYGYNFKGFELIKHVYPSAVRPSSERDVINIISIKMSDETFNLTIYSSATEPIGG